MSYRRLCAIALLLIGFCTQASAESWPTKPIRAIVPYSPGSATDIIPRKISKLMAPGGCHAVAAYKTERIRAPVVVVKKRGIR